MADQWPVARAALTDTTNTPLVAAPAASNCIVVYGMFGSNAGASLSTVSWKDGATKKFDWSMAANGGGFAIPMTRGWRLSPGTALYVAQDASVVASISVQYAIERA